MQFKNRRTGMSPRHSSMDLTSSAHHSFSICPFHGCFRNRETGLRLERHQSCSNLKLGMPSPRPPATRQHQTNVGTRRYISPRGHVHPKRLAIGQKSPRSNAIDGHGRPRVQGSNQVFVCLLINDRLYFPPPTVSPSGPVSKLFRTRKQGQGAGLWSIPSFGSVD